MSSIMCENCGANEFYEKDGYRICAFCGSKYEIKSTKAISSIALNEDVQRLLDKCVKEPWKARKYANLILDIDPHNKEALKYL